MAKVAVVGCGKWGMNLARNFMELGALEAICEKSEARALELRSAFKDVMVFNDLDELLSRDSVDAIVVATPPHVHHSVGMRALKAGKHLFVEKPMTLEAGEAKELDETAHNLGLHLMVGHILLYHPAYVKLREIVAAGELGEICYIHSERIGLGRVRREEDAMFSLAPHDISAMLYVFNDSPVALSCSGMNYLQENIMDMAYLNLRFKGKRMGHIHVSWLSPEKIRQHTVVGTRKMARVDEVIGKGALKLFHRHIEPDSLAAVNGEIENIELLDEEPLRQECRHFLQCLEKNERPRSDGCQGVDVVKILNAARESSNRQGEWISLEETCRRI